MRGDKAAVFLRSRQTHVVALTNVPHPPLESACMAWFVCRAPYTPPRRLIPSLIYIYIVIIWTSCIRVSILPSFGDIKGKKILDPPIFLLSLYLSSLVSLRGFLHFAFWIIVFSLEYLSLFFCKIIIFERVSYVIFDVSFFVKIIFIKN